MLKQSLTLAGLLIFFQPFSQAATYTVSSEITDVKHVIVDNLYYYLESSNPSANNVSYSGTFDITITGNTYSINSGLLSMDGSYIAFTAGGVYLEKNYEGVQGQFDTTTGSINMNQGTIEVFAEGAPYDIVNVASKNIYYDNNEVCLSKNFLLKCTHWQPLSGIDMLSGTINPDGSITINLAGIPAILNSPDDFDRITTTADVFGFEALQFQQGTITLTEVPLPSGIWLFGSALLGVSAIKRKNSYHK